MLALSTPARGPDCLTTTSGGSVMTAWRASWTCDARLVLSALCFFVPGKPAADDDRLGVVLAVERDGMRERSPGRAGTEEHGQPGERPLRDLRRGDVPARMRARRVEPARDPGPDGLARTCERLEDERRLVVGAGLDLAAVWREDRQAGRILAQQLLGQPHRPVRVATGELGLQRRPERGRGFAGRVLEARQSMRSHVRRPARRVDLLGDRVERHALGDLPDEHLATDGAGEERRATPSPTRSAPRRAPWCSGLGLMVSVEREVRIAIAVSRASPSHHIDHDELTALNCTGSGRRGRANTDERRGDDMTRCLGR